MQTEVLMMWLAVSAYALSAILFVFGAVFRAEKLLSIGLWTAAAGLVPHIAGIALRWQAVGHGPFLGFYEVVSSYAFLAVIALVALALWRRPLQVLGVGVVPVALLMLGGAMLAPRSPLEISAKLASWWLTIHVAFAKLSYTSFIAAAALGLVFIIRERRKEGSDSGLLAKLPSQAVLDDVSFRLVGVGFVFLSIMIVAGAIWANEAWGRYWAWDPIETWSLISWIVYAIYLHLRLTMGWRGRKAATYAVIALPVMVFTLIGVPVVYNSIHGAYLTGY
ncbi:MAG TPA: c-type cytochrome biogenesis protein CcsB [Coriobacteriia bacterium]|nr:c-type cytochrome biogenesis protein CcsB [Coriobacteriia bacterium]